jgi:integrase/recombinase XerD
LADLPALWLGARGRPPMSYSSLYTTLRRRGEECGFEVTPHMLRRSGAIAWREQGGSIPGLMTQAGWKSLREVMRYSRQADVRLSLEEAKRLARERLR